MPLAEGGISSKSGKALGSEGSAAWSGPGTALAIKLYVVPRPTMLRKRLRER